MYCLKITTSDERVTTYEFKKPMATLGRETDNEIVLDDLRVSRHHALFACENDLLRITDLNSGNGTFINGKRIEMHTAKTLADGDKIKIGSTEICVYVETTARLTQADQGLQPLLQKLPSEIYETIVTYNESAPASATAALGLALENKGRILKLFYELSQKLGSVLEPAEIYDQILNSVLSVTPAVRVVILEKDEDGDYLPVAMRWREGHANTNEEIPISQLVLTRVAAQRAGFLLADVAPENVDFTIKTLLVSRIRSVIAAPIIAQNELLGMIYADLRDSSNRFTEEDLELLNAIAIQTGLALNTSHAHNRLQKQAAERARFERFLPQTVVDAVIRGSGALKLGGERKEITVLFADLRGFTTLSEARQPEEVVEILNRYFSLASALIFKHGGTLDKYIGDGLFAFFGAPYPDRNHPLNAVRAAWELQQAIPEFNESLRRDDLPPIAVGIGINTGTALIGYIGSESRHDYTAIGDAVNVAARLEKLAQPHQILVSETTVNAIKDEYVFRPLGTTPLKGKAKHLKVSEVINKIDVSPNKTKVILG